MVPDYTLEADAGGLVAGVDEAGRGPLAGPVLAGAVMFLAPCPAPLAALLDDSKRLSPAAREVAATAIRAAARDGKLVFALGAASAREIATHNILAATHIAMCRAVMRLTIRPDVVLVDGNRAPNLPCPVRCVVGGMGCRSPSPPPPSSPRRCATRAWPSWPAPGRNMASRGTRAMAPRCTATPSPGTAPARTTAAVSRPSRPRWSFSAVDGTTPRPAWSLTDSRRG